ncbi:hypothetical protein [Spirillospora sp. NPDC047279]|uniref:hypothetical protein n=1 Tax=Spirillospora sp. NPDC047279 TaxID=3155478 RepID=UPI0033E71B7B
MDAKAAFHKMAMALEEGGQDIRRSQQNIEAATRYREYVHTLQIPVLTLEGRFLRWLARQLNTAEGTMVATKVNVSAVRIELARISSLMSEVSRQMGPQVWQGGSAANFTIDLRGHSRSLEQMMARILEAVASMNAVPMVYDVPEIAPVAPQPSAGVFNQVASVSVSGLQRLESALKHAADALPGHGRRLRTLMAEGGPVEVSTAQCQRTASWCAGQARPMKTRIHYALVSDNVGVTWGTPKWGMSGVPDVERFGTGQMAELARLQAQAYGKALQAPDAQSRTLLIDVAASLRENGKDTAYLATFFGSVKPGSVGTLAHNLHKQGGAENSAPLGVDDKKILADIGTALAVLSRKKDGQSVVWKAMGGAGSDMPGQALLIKLSDPNVKWSSAVLVELSKAALRWRQKYPSYEISVSGGSWGESHTSVVNQPHRKWWDDWGINGGSGIGDTDLKRLREYDPALNLLGRIIHQNDTSAAREVVSSELDKAFTVKDADKAKAITWVTRGNGETYAALLAAPDWMDEGTAAGKIIALATRPEKGHESQAAENAAEIMRTVAWWNETGRAKVDAFLGKGRVPKWMPWLHDDRGPDWFSDSRQFSAEYGAGLREGLLRMTRMHIPAIANSDRSSGGTVPDIDPVTGRTFVAIDGDEMAAFLRTFPANDRHWAQLGVDTQIYRQKLFEWALRNRSFLSGAQGVGWLDGNLIRAYVDERTEREKLTKKQYEDVQKRLAALRDLGGTVLGETPVGKVPGSGDVYTMTTDLGLNKIKYKEFEKKVKEIDDRYANYSDQFHVDLVRAYRRQLGTSIPDSEIEALLNKKGVLSKDESALLVTWSRRNLFGTTAQSGGQKIYGRDIVGAAQAAFDHNTQVKTKE